MKTNELKKVLKPLIKQCIKEVIFEDGVLSGIISEVVKGVNVAPVIKEEKTKAMLDLQERERIEKKNEMLKEQRRKILDSIGKDSFNGVNVFEGTDAMAPESNSHSPLANVAPNDSGVDIAGLFNSNWSKLI